MIDSPLPRGRTSAISLPWHVIGLVLVLVVAAAARFASPEVVSYRQDHADLATLAQDMAEGKTFPLLGIPSSARFPNSPMTVYLVVLPYLISDSPLLAGLYVSTLNVIGVGLLWLLAYRYFNPTIAFIAALAYAVHPWAIGYSRSLWAQNYHTPFILLGLLLGLLGFIEGKRWAQVACLPVLFIAMQVHFAAWLLFPVYLWLLWVGRSRVSKKALALSVILAALTLLPFALGMAQLLTQESSASTPLQVQSREFNLRNLAKPYGQVAWLMTGLGLEQYTARARGAEMVAFTGMPTALWILLGAMTLLGAVILWWKWPRWLAVLVSLWLFLPLLVLTVPFIDVFAHYFVPQIPGYSLLAAVGAHGILTRLRSRVGEVIVWGALATIFSTQFIFSLRVLQYIDQTYLPTQFGFGPSLHHLMRVQNTLIPYEDVVIIGSGDWVDISASGASVWSSLLRDSASCVRDVVPQANAAVLPARPFAAVFAPLAHEITPYTELYQVGQGVEIPLRPEEGVYKVYALDQTPTWTGAPLTDVQPTSFESGVQLTGFGLEGNRAYLRWTLPERPARAANLVYTVALMNGEETPSTFDFWPSRYWCAGDQLITWADIAAAEPITAARVSLHMPGKMPEVWVDVHKG